MLSGASGTYFISHEKTAGILFGWWTLLFNLHQAIVQYYIYESHKRRGSRGQYRLLEDDDKQRRVPHVCLML